MRHDRGAAALAALALTAGHAGPALCQYSPVLRRALGVRDRLDDASAVALTFDDGPHPRGTPAILDVLRKAGVRATFFLVGEQIARYPAIASDVAAAGHVLGVHGHRHRSLLCLTPGQVRDDLQRAEAAFWEVADVAPTLYRPPYGVLTAAALV